MKVGDIVVFEGKQHIIISKYSDRYKPSPRYWYEIKKCRAGEPVSTNFSQVVRLEHLTKKGTK